MKKMKIYLRIIILILGSTYLIETCDARFCYVCGEGSDEPFENIETLFAPVSCHEPNAYNSAVQKYLLECPDDYNGCITQIDGLNIMRTCEKLGLNDCKTANNIIYCYCNSDYCNNSTATQIRKNQQRENQRKYFVQANDDEDSAESSGTGATSEHKYFKVGTSNGRKRIAVNQTLYSLAPSRSTTNIFLMLINYFLGSMYFLH